MGRRKRGWNAAAGLSLADLRRLVDEKLAAVDKLSTRRDEIAAQLAEVDAEIAAAGPKGAMPAARRGPGRPPKSAVRRGPGRPPKARRRPGRPPKLGRPKGKRDSAAKGKGQSPLHDMIRGVLKVSSEPMKLADIAEKVKTAGYKTKSSNFGVILGLRLSEMGDVKRVERGVYAMK